MVGAEAIVTMDVPTNAVMAGSPAQTICTVEEYAKRSFERMIKYDRELFKKDKREELLKHFPYPW